MKPPWILFPELSSAKPAHVAACIEYGDGWLRFFRALIPPEQAEYQRSNPEPAAWQGVYRAILEDEGEDEGGYTVPNPRRPMYPGLSVALRMPRPPEQG